MDVGRKRSSTMLDEPKKDEITYPYLRIENPPDEMMAHEVGHMCEMKLIAKVSYKTIDKEHKSMELEVHKLGHMEMVKEKGSMEKAKEAVKTLKSSKPGMEKT